MIWSLDFKVSHFPGVSPQVLRAHGENRDVYSISDGSSECSSESTNVDTESVRFSAYSVRVIFTSLHGDHDSINWILHVSQMNSTCSNGWFWAWIRYMLTVCLCEISFLQTGFDIYRRQISTDFRSVSTTFTKTARYYKHSKLLKFTCASLLNVCLLSQIKRDVQSHVFWCFILNDLQ